MNESVEEDELLFVGAASAWQGTMLIGIVTLVLGLIVAFHPSTSLNVIAVLIGITVIIAGLFHLIRAFGGDERHRVWLGIAGLVLVVVGVALIRHLHLTVALIGLLVGVTWIVQGVAALAGGLSRGSAEGRGWWILFGIISLIGGIVITAAPVTSVTALAILLGIWFAVDGVCMIVAALMLRRAIRKPHPAPVPGATPVG